MKRLIILTTLVAICTFSLSGQEVHQLTIEITGIKKVKGKIDLCLVTEASQFLSSCTDYNELEVNARQLTLTKPDVKPGFYAVTMIHDSNDNGKLDTNFFGIPTERYGFSNNPRTTFGPPGYKKCLFEVKSDTTIQIRLK